MTERPRIADFNGDGRNDILFYYLPDHKWWLGTFKGNKLSWNLASDSKEASAALQLWMGDFSGDRKIDLLNYIDRDKKWWLGTFNGNQLSWNPAGSTPGLGSMTRFWVGDFTGNQKDDILFYAPEPKDWWLGTLSGNQLSWKFLGNTSNLGNLSDGRPIWIGNFNGDGRDDILFRDPFSKTWWLGSFNEQKQLSWGLVGNTFGDTADGPPFWIGDFNGDGKDDILCYAPKSKNWWLGTFSGNKLSWSLTGNTSGFGDLADGRPFWIGSFNGDRKDDILFYFPGDHNWWLGTLNEQKQLSWSLAGNYSLGQFDKDLIWIVNFNGDGKDDILYLDGDKNWRLGTFNGNQLSWNIVDNGEPPRLIIFEPQMGRAGDTVTIDGSFVGFQEVRFGDIRANATLSSRSTRITATVPENVVTGPITVITSFGNLSSVIPFYVKKT